MEKSIIEALAQLLKSTIKEAVREVVAEEVTPSFGNLNKTIKEEVFVKESPIGKTYTTSEVITLLRCDKSTLWRWAKEGKLVPIKSGERNLYRHEDIKKFVNI